MMKRALKILGYVLVIVYFVADLAFESNPAPISRTRPVLHPRRR